MARYSTGPAAELLEYDEYNERERLRCPQCNWRGRAKDASHNLYSELFDVSCPRCERMLLVVGFPIAADRTDE